MGPASKDLPWIFDHDATYRDLATVFDDEAEIDSLPRQTLLYEVYFFTNIATVHWNK